MRVMILSMMALAGFGAAFLFCPPLRNKMTAVMFGQHAQVEATETEENLAARAAEAVKSSAASALRCVQTKAGTLIGSSAPAPAADRADERRPSPATRESSDLPPARAKPGPNTS